MKIDNLNKIRELIFTDEVHNIELALILAYTQKLDVKSIFSEWLATTEIVNIDIMGDLIKIRKSKHFRTGRVERRFMYYYDNISHLVYTSEACANNFINHINKKQNGRE